MRSMDPEDLFLDWQEAFESGETKEDWETWYSGKCADAYDRAKALRQDEGVP